MNKNSYKQRESILSNLEEDGLFLKNVPANKQDHKMCLVALRQNPLALEFVALQTEQMCRDAVYKNVNAFKFVKNQSPSLCLYALNKKKSYLKYIKICSNKNFKPTISLLEKQRSLVYKLPHSLKECQDEFLCIQAVNENWKYISKIKNPTIEMIKIGCLQDHDTLFKVKKPSSALVLEMLEFDGHYIQKIKKQTEEQCFIAVRSSSHSLEYIHNQTEALCLEAIEKNDHGSLSYVKDKTPAICLAAVTKNGYQIKDVSVQTEELCLAAIKSNPEAIEYITNPTEDMCRFSLSLKPDLITRIKNPSEESVLFALNKVLEENGSLDKLEKEFSYKLKTAKVSLFFLKKLNLTEPNKLDDFYRSHVGWNGEVRACFSVKQKTYFIEKCLLEKAEKERLEKIKENKISLQSKIQAL